MLNGFRVTWARARAAAASRLQRQRKTSAPSRAAPTHFHRWFLHFRAFPLIYLLCRCCLCLCCLLRGLRRCQPLARHVYHFCESHCMLSARNLWGVLILLLEPAVILATSFVWLLAGAACDCWMLIVGASSAAGSNSYVLHLFATHCL